MPLRYRGGAPLYGKTLQTVLGKRPCRVIVSAHPGEARRRLARRERIAVSRRSPRPTRSTAG